MRRATDDDDRFHQGRIRKRNLIADLVSGLVARTIPMRRATTDDDGPVSSRTRSKTKSNRRFSQRIVARTYSDAPATTDDDGPVSSRTGRKRNLMQFSQRANA